MFDRFMFVTGWLTAKSDQVNHFENPVCVTSSLVVYSKEVCQVKIPKSVLKRCETNKVFGPSLGQVIIIQLILYELYSSAIFLITTSS